MANDFPDEAPFAEDAIPKDNAGKNELPSMPTTQESLGDISYNYNVKPYWGLTGMLYPLQQLQIQTDVNLVRYTKLINRRLSDSEVSGLVEMTRRMSWMRVYELPLTILGTTMHLSATWQECRYPFKTQRLLHGFGWSYDGYNIFRYSNPVFSGREAKLFIHLPRAYLYWNLWHVGAKAVVAANIAFQSAKAGNDPCLKDLNRDMAAANGAAYVSKQRDLSKR